MNIAVIICTHNPREDYLKRTIESLKQQNLSRDQWSLTIIDNASDSPISELVDLKWHPKSKILREEKIGLVHARIKGIGETAEPLIIFVDDDNLLDTEYLSTSLKISKEYPFLGCWGGRIEPEFEDPEFSPKTPYHYILAIRYIDKILWSNDPENFESSPIGAGMCLRRKVATQHIKNIEENPRKLDLGRMGNKMVSAEDIDIIATNCKMELGKGVFPALKIIHLIPRQRMEKKFLYTLSEGNAYSKTLFDFFEHQKIRKTRSGFISKTIWLLKLLRMDSFSRNMEISKERGIKSAISFLKEKKLI